MKIAMTSSVLALALALGGCGQKETPAPAQPAAPAPGPNLTQTPDVGKIEQVATSATGSGVTPGAAVNDALKNAIMQVNGTTVQATSVSANMFAQVNATLDVETEYGRDSAKLDSTMQGQAFAERIVAESKGVVSSFKVGKITPPAAKGGAFTVTIDAQIAKFKAPADSGKIKIVVAPLRSERSSFNIGGRAVPAAEVLGAVRQQIIDALTQTGRFTVLDRQFEDELQNELDMIGSGQTVNTDFAKMGQALSADLVWVGVVNELAYERHARQLQTSDRELVSYSGGWSVSQRMINLATRQILQSTTLRGAPPSTAPTTLGSGINQGAILKNIEIDIVKQTTAAILARTFPISVVERDGNNVVLSQGGSALVENGRYRVYLQGKEIKDPQTGQSLGNIENACCDVLINRVTPNLSYGVLENVTGKLDGVAPGALQVREAVSGAPARSAAAPADEPKAKAPAKAAAQPKKAAVAEAPAKKDDW
ncbi:CsgG/HfaB family protein [Janthinobacterium fluminis]|uniref:CsgG/HfaB family protein n=1 Tax=Janthinobacterium fluminis TaxID=2987524 RepID=A0ABT5K0B5_9BURK|nr:CsgG/HfaB family protein [Janthinobacterium fluminis]MDC8758145.1 CsgG/HfaB family protein [Janthinobacterium fluminis]